VCGSEGKEGCRGERKEEENIGDIPTTLRQGTRGRSYPSEFWRALKSPRL